MFDIEGVLPLDGSGFVDEPEVGVECCEDYCAALEEES